MYYSSLQTALNPWDQDEMVESPVLLLWLWVQQREEVHPHRTLYSTFTLLYDTGQMSQARSQMPDNRCPHRHGRGRLNLMFGPVGIQPPLYLPFEKILSFSKYAVPNKTELKKQQPNSMIYWISSKNTSTTQLKEQLLFLVSAGLLLFNRLKSSFMKYSYISKRKEMPQTFRGTGNCRKTLLLDVNSSPYIFQFQENFVTITVYFFCMGGGGFPGI